MNLPRSQAGLVYWFGLILTVCVAVPLLLVSWIGVTPAGLRWTLSLFPQTSFTGVSGTLWEGFTIDSLEWESTNADGKHQQIAASDVLVVIDWSALSQRTIQIEKIQAQAVSLSFPASEDPKPIVLPNKIQFPLDIELQDLRIAQLNVSPSVQLDQVAGWAVVRDGGLTVERFSTQLDNADLVMSGHLVLEQPYTVSAQARATRTLQGLDLTAEATASGSLDRMALNLNAMGQQASKQGKGEHTASQIVQADAVLHPLSVAPVESARVKARDLNPRDWLSAAPSASLDIDLAIAPNADFSLLKATLKLVNQNPVALQRGGIPVSHLTAAANAALEHGVPVQGSIAVHPLQLADEGGQGGALRLDADLERDGTLRWTANGQSIRPTVLVDTAAADTVDLTLEGSKQAQRWTVRTLQVQQKKAALEASGQISLTGNWPASVQVRFKHLNPADWLPGASAWGRGDLNGDGQFEGRLKTTRGAWMPSGRLRSELTDSRLANAPIEWSAKVDGNQDRLSQVQVDLNLLGNSLKAQGSYGAPGDALSLDMALPNLAAVGRAIQRPMAGDVRLTAQLQGTGLMADVKGALQVNGLRWVDQVVVKRIQGTFAVGSRAESPWAMDVQAEGIGKPQPGNQQLQVVETWVKNLRLVLDGTRNRHTLSGKVSTGLTPFSRQRPLQAEFSLTGGLGAQATRPGKPMGWKGVMNSFKTEGLWNPARSLTLQQPVSMVWAPRFFELGALALIGEDKTLIRNAMFSVDGPSVRIEGDMPAFGIPRLSPILKTQASVEPKDLVARVNWTYRANAAGVKGVVDVRHVSGGLQVLEDSQIDVPIERFDAHLQFDRKAASLKVDIAAPRFAAINAELILPVEKNPVSHQWGLAGNGPMQGSVAAGLYQLNWLGPLLSGGVRTNGTGQLAVAIAGSLNEPDVQGRLFAMGLDIFQLDQGVRLEDGNVVVDFNTSRARIEQAEFTVYNRKPPRKRIEQLGPLIQGAGKVTVAGEWNLNGLKGGLMVKAQRAPLVQRFDRWVMLDAGLQVQQPDREGEPLRVRGDVDVLGAYIETPDAGAPTLSDDVIIQGKNPAGTATLPLDVQLQARLGKLFYVSAEGLNTRLEGGMRLSLLDGVGGSGNRRSGRRLSATGTIQTADGTYRAYGQDLTIERGVVNFQGPLENPGINVRAVRKGVAVEAGVEITGTAQRPKVTLVSDPAVPDSEKLSWMIIGRGTNSADRDQTLLLTAAAAIFGNDDESPTRKIARQLGIDDVALSTGSLTAADSRAVGSKVAVAPGADVSANVIGADDPLLSQRIITVGKRITDKVYASFDQSVTTAASVLKLNYQYSRQLSLIARTGADNALDVLYQISFD